MLIPNKHSGYQAGIRLYPGGGGGTLLGTGDSQGGNPGITGAVIPPAAPTVAPGAVFGTGNSQVGNTGGATGITGAVIPAPTAVPGSTVFGMGDSQVGNTGGATGITGVVIPPPASTVVPGMGDSQVGNTGGATGVTGAVIPPARPTGVPPITSPFRPMSGADQFYQPVYQPQYQDYNMGNRMGVSQFGQGMGGFNPFAMQMQTPFNPYTNSFQPQMGMGMQTPFSSGMSQPRQQPIVTRSARARGTPNVMMRRAEGGIASLVDDE